MDSWLPDVSEDPAPGATFPYPEKNRTSAVSAPNSAVPPCGTASTVPEGGALPTGSVSSTAADDSTDLSCPAQDEALQYLSSAPADTEVQEESETSRVLMFPEILKQKFRSAVIRLSRWIWSSAALSLSCQIMTAPLVWLRFRTFPQYFFLTNLLALPLTSLIMVSALVTLCLSALGICPEIAIRLTDALCGALETALQIISGM